MAKQVLKTIGVDDFINHAQPVNTRLTPMGLPLRGLSHQNAA